MWCGLGVKLSGSAGGGGSGAGGSDTGAGAAPVAFEDLPEGTCWTKAVDPQPVEGAAYWGGHTSTEGSVVNKWCKWSGIATITNLVPYFLASGAAPPPVDPAIVAQQALSLLTIPAPDSKFGPDPTRLAVSMWTYLWVTDPGPLTATATAGAVSVTATATLTSVTWAMGEPVSLDKPGMLSAPFSCEGAGIDPGHQANIRIKSPKAPGTCAYVFHWRSLADRTNDTGTWPVTAQATWTVTWTSNVGVSGTAELNRSSVTPVFVSEWKAVLVGPGG